jgi:preprotein translocase subunit SecE
VVIGVVILVSLVLAFYDVIIQTAVKWLLAR